MNFYVLSSLMASVTLSVMGIFMLINGKSRLEIRIWGYICFGVVFWQIGSLGFSTATSKEMAFYWWQFAHIGAMIVPPIFFHFICIYLKINRKWLQIFAYAFSIIFIVINFCWGIYFIGDLRLTPDHFYWIDWLHYRNPLFIAYYAIAYALLLGYSYIILLKAFKHSSGIRRKQFQYLIIGTAVAWSGPAGIIISYFRIDLYAYTNLLMGLFPLIMGYAIVRHQLMDIELIIKKTLVFAGLSTLILGITSATSFLVQDVLGRFYAIPKTLSIIIGFIIFVALYEPTKKFLVGATDRYLFQKKYDYNQVWRAFIDEVITLLDLDKIIDKTLELLKKTLHPERAAIFLADARGDLSLEGSYDCPVDIALSADSLIPMYLKERRSVISTEVDSHNHVSTGIREEMKRLGMVLAVPLILRDELIGIVFLGKKKSDEHYSNDDLNLIIDLAKTEAIAIKNAQLTKEISDASEEKGIEDASLGASHQMKNTLAVIKPPLETIYALISYTDLNTITLEKSKSLISSSKERIAKVLEEIEKGRKIINSILYGDQKEDDAPKEINIYSLVQHSLERSSQAKSQDLVARNIPIPALINNVPENFPTIVASGVLIGEALINIINNSFDAIIERYVHIKQDSSYKGIIKLSAEDNGKYIKLSIEDNGMGMTEETKKKAFKGLYTTKKASARGRGAALFFLKKWLKARGGTVSFTSEYGQGTKFTIELPKKPGEYQ